MVLPCGKGKPNWRRAARAYGLSWFLVESDSATCCWRPLAWTTHLSLRNVMTFVAITFCSCCRHSMSIVSHDVPATSSVCTPASAFSLPCEFRTDCWQSNSASLHHWSCGNAAATISSTWLAQCVQLATPSTIHASLSFQAHSLCQRERALLVVCLQLVTREIADARNTAEHLCVHCVDRVLRDGWWEEAH